MLRPVRHWCFHVAQALSLVLCLTGVVMGGRSLWVGDLWDVNSLWWPRSGLAPAHRWIVGSGRGQVRCMRTGLGPYAFPWYHFSGRPSDAVAPLAPWTEYGLPGVLTVAGPWDGSGQFAVTANYLLLAGAAALPVVWARRRRLRAARRHGLCRICGYDLRASKDHCPECGAPIPEKPARSPAAH